ncbi:sporulation protein [Staphylococcus sp. 17KM0847]|uniref:sporulation protein n=1 Tax=Staphylococcus sp. 17KM0847 TaxID=2583989 RepID=UPI0015DC8086|nr:sporulation protein [Staphylococcus sp. 17KM0847]QLK86214.1 hypothetical protein FGL66_05530 [Staphylococcus sp. 17KM0847]
MGFDNVLTSLGINGMKVLIHLDQQKYTVDDAITGYIKLKAGQSDQKVTHIELKLLEKYENNDETSEFTRLTREIDHFVIDDTFTIDVGEQKKILFKFKPKQWDFKSEASQIILNTHVYIDLGIDEEVEAVIPYIH